MQKMTVKTFNYQIRTTTFEGKEHLVVPVVMMTEGVHNGSGGAVYHSIEELGKFPESWNGIPVSIFHPENDSGYISANSPDVIETRTVGRIFNTHVDGKKLKAECWIDVEKIQNISPMAYDYIIGLRPLEVSIGVFTEDEAVDGTWNGETYHAIARNHRPDHLALLPGGQGACSWEDGAGIRANAQQKDGEKMDKNVEVTDKQQYLKFMFGTFQEMGYNEIASQLQDKLNAFDNGSEYFYLEEVFADTFVYRVRNNTTQESRFFKRTYSVGTDGVITFGENTTPVQKVVEYKTINTNEHKGVKKNMDVKAHVDSLISSGIFKEEDRGRLEGLDVDILSAMKPKVNEEPKEQEEKPVVFGKDEAISVLQDTLKTPEQFLNLLPSEMQDQFASGLKLHQAQKTALIDRIVGYNSAYTKEELKTATMDSLVKLASFIPEEKTDYSVFGANSTGVTSEAPLIPVGIVGMVKESK